MSSKRMPRNHDMSPTGGAFPAPAASLLTPDDQSWRLHEYMAVMVDAEFHVRHNRRIHRLIKHVNFRTIASDAGALFRRSRGNR